MYSCSVTRTHRRGVALRDRDFDPPVDGDAALFSAMHPELKRMVQIMTLRTAGWEGPSYRPPIPDLLQPELITFASDRAMMIAGFEEIDGQRFYQGWYVRFLWR